MGNRGRPKHPDILTPREWEVLALLRENRTNEEIAETLGVTLATARFHVSEILGKLGVSSRHEAAAWQPEREPTPRRLWAFAPIVLLRRMRWQTLWAPLGVLTIVAALSLVAALVWGASRTGIAPAAFGDPATFCTPGPTPKPAPTLGPIERLTPQNTPDLRPDSTRMAEIDQYRRRNHDWTARFIAAGCDPHTLVDMWFEVYNPGPTYKTFEQAIGGADAIVRAHVDHTAFSIGDDPTNQLGSAHVSMTVLESVKGDVPRSLDLYEAGGPVPQAYWGGLDHAEGLPIPLTGDDVILLLYRPQPDHTQNYALLPYRGVLQIRDGLVHAEVDDPCASAINRRTVDKELELIRAALARLSTGQAPSSSDCE